MAEEPAGPIMHPQPESDLPALNHTEDGLPLDGHPSDISVIATKKLHHSTPVQLFDSPQDKVQATESENSIKSYDSSLELQQSPSEKPTLSSILDEYRELSDGVGTYTPPSEDEVSPAHINVRYEPNLHSILAFKHRNEPHPYPTFRGSERSEKEGSHGRTKSRHVVFNLSRDFIEREQITKNSKFAPKLRQASKGVTLMDLRRCYDSSCAIHNVAPLTEILASFEIQEETTKLPPDSITLRDLEGLSNEHISTICDLIQNNGDLVSIELHAIGIKDKQFEKICLAILANRTLEKLNISGNHFLGKTSMACLRFALDRIPCLQYLNLSGIVFTAPMALLLKDGLSSSQLSTLIMHRCGLHAPEVLTPIISGCISCKTLTNISFKSNEIEEGQAKWIALLLQLETSIVCLDLRSNLLGDVGASVIASPLATNKTLQKLVLYDNGIRDYGATALFKALETNTSLSYLDLSANSIGSAQTMEALKKAVIPNTTLRSLYLWGTNLKNEGSIVLAEALTENSTLFRLELRNNDIGLAGILAFSHTMKLNETLGKLMIDIPPLTNSESSMFCNTLMVSIMCHCRRNIEKLHMQEFSGDVEERHEEEEHSHREPQTETDSGNEMHNDSELQPVASSADLPMSDTDTDNKRLCTSAPIVLTSSDLSLSASTESLVPNCVDASD